MIIIIRINYTRIQNLSGDVCEAEVVLSSFYGVGGAKGRIETVRELFRVF